MLAVLCVLGLALGALGSDYAGHFTNDFAVEIPGGSDVAGLVAEAHGFTLVKNYHSLENLYHFRHEATSYRSKRSVDQPLIEKLRNDPNVVFAEQQKILGRYKRASIPDEELLTRDKRFIVHDKQLEDIMVHHNRDDLNPTSMKVRKELQVTTADMGINFNDPQFTRMWYLINKGQTGGPKGNDVNVLPVWQKGITGKDVVVCILDDGVDHTHQDLVDNYDPKASADFNDERDKNNDPMPQGNLQSNSHGTKCAGEVAAAANNSVCGIGIAYNAKIGGVRMLDGLITDATEGGALTFANDYVDIYSASWGPSDDGKTMEGLGPIAAKEIKRGATEGRDGKGSLYVWATGNGGGNDDDCNCDGYVSSIYSISIGCISDWALSTYFSEICPSTMAVIYTGGSHETPDSKGYEDPPIKVITVDVGGNGDRCTDDFMGTSAAAPLAAGAFALVLEANPDLTWRDVQHIVVETASLPNPTEEGTIINGGGHHLNHRFGFGSLDVGKMVEAAQKWKQVPEQRQCDVDDDNEAIEFESGETVVQTLETDGCKKGKQPAIDLLEHTQVHIELDHTKRGDLNITLISPRGTPSQLLSERPKDYSDEGIYWIFMTVHNWSEDPSGKWELRIQDVSKSGNKGTLFKWSMTLFGIKGQNPNRAVGIDSGAENVDTDPNRDHNDVNDAHSAGTPELKVIMDKEKDGSDTVEIKSQTKDGKDIKGFYANSVSRDDEIDEDMYKSIAKLFLSRDLKSKKQEEEEKRRQERQREILEEKQRELEEEKEKEVLINLLGRALDEIEV